MALDPDQLARKIADHLLSQEGTGPAWGVEIEDAREGYSRIAITVRPDMLNGHGIVHGGMLAAFLDSAMGTAVFHGIGRRAVTLKLSIDYLGPGRIGDWLQAEGEVIAHDEDVAQVRGRLYGPRHDVLAGLGIFSLLSRKRVIRTRS